MINRAFIELASVDDCTAIARIDGRAVSSNIRDYVRNNRLSYYIAINTWLMVINDCSTPACLRVKSAIYSAGLISTINRFAEAADELVHGLPISDDLVRNVLHDIVSHRPTVPRQNENRAIWADPMAASLFICRYLKRFCPLNADKYDAQVIKDFLDNQNRIKMLQRRPTPKIIVSYIKDALSEIRFDLILEDIRNFDIADLEITHGVGFDAKAPLVSKLKALLKTCPTYFYQPFGVNMTPCDLNVWEPEEYGAYGDPKHLAKVSCVPKNYKTNRMIAMEDTYRQAYAKRMFQIVDRYLPDCLNLHDQTRNQRLACDGSLTGDLATLDMHAASDSVSWTLCQDVLPTEFIEFLREIRPTHILINNKERPIYAFATMGNAMTFVVETIIFWGIVRAACNFAAIFGIPNSRYVSVYGDDIVCPAEVAEIAIEWLEACGFIVNVEKSFFTHESLYRESCGEEYHLGTCVSSLYYPRFTPRGNITATSVAISNYRSRDGFTEEAYDSTSRLVDLQHKMSLVSDTAGIFLAELIREADPKMTCSSYGSICSDLWDYESKPAKGYVPLGEIFSTKVLVPDGDKYRHVERRQIKRLPSEHEREGHSIRVDKYVQQGEDSLGKRLYDLYKYQNFLRFGPRYDELAIVSGTTYLANYNKLAGISCPPVPYAKVAGVPKSSWIYQF